MSQNFRLDHQIHRPEVQAQILWLQQHQDALYRTLQAAAPYIYYIYQQTQARGIPAELALLPVIESKYDPYAYSHAGASGLWQLMPKTASHLGVKIDRFYDGRRDLIASTNAALDYLTRLHGILNNEWALTIAGYDCGVGTVQTAMQRSHSSDFWKLPLPAETKLYIPKLLALAAVIANPARYHLQLPPIKNVPYFAEVKVKANTDIKKAAQSSGIELKALKNLNAAYTKLPAVAARNQTLLVPIAKAADFKANLVEVAAKTSHTASKAPSLADNNFYYTVKPHDTLYHIAKTHHLSVAYLEKENHLKSDIVHVKQKLDLGDEISTPVIKLAAKKKTPNKKLEYIVREDDTLDRIAKHFNTSVASLKINNHLSGNIIKPGDTLVISAEEPRLHSAETDI